MLDNIERKTLKADIFRTLGESFIIPMFESLILLVAIRYFEADDFQKSLVSSARFIGMFLSLLIFSFFSRYNIKKTVLLFFITLTAAVFLLGSALAPSVWIFTVCMFLYTLLVDSRYPLVTALYSENYKEERRGKMVSVTFILSSLMMLLISYISSTVLGNDLGRFRIIFAVFSAMLMISALLFRRIPSSPNAGRIKLRECFGLLIKYPKFTYILVVWSIFGIANIATFPLRIVYLAEKERGLGLDPGTVIILTSIIPVICRLASNYFWAILFDRINVVIMRILLNLFIGGGIFLFFITSNLYVIALSVVITYIGFGGTPIVWPLWVTKIAPVKRIPEFMALHTFMTGIRGIIGPFAGFLYISILPIKSAGITAGLLFLVSILMLVPLIKMKRLE